MLLAPAYSHEPAVELIASACFLARAICGERDPALQDRPPP